MIEDKLHERSKSSNDVWSSFVGEMVKKLIFPKINQMTIELNRLVEDISFLKNKAGSYRKRIEQMENTFSWRITAPLRDSKLLRGLITRLKK